MVGDTHSNVESSIGMADCQMSCRGNDSVLTTRAARVTRNTRVAQQVAKSMEVRGNMKQNVTISLDRQTLRKAKIIAAKQGTSISGLLAEQIEVLVGEEEAYEHAERQALALLEQGFHMGGVIHASRDELHER